VHTADEGMPFVGGELEDRAADVPAIANSYPTGEVRDFDAVAIGETQRALHPVRILGLFRQISHANTSLFGVVIGYDTQPLRYASRFTMFRVAVWGLPRCAFVSRDAILQGKMHNSYTVTHFRTTSNNSPTMRGREPTPKGDDCGAMHVLRC
jgi:hypothetical protein